jgi:hypothetical protein
MAIKIGVHGVMLIIEREGGLCERAGRVVKANASKLLQPLKSFLNHKDTEDTKRIELFFFPFVIFAPLWFVLIF